MSETSVQRNEALCYINKDLSDNAANPSTAGKGQVFNLIMLLSLLCSFTAEFHLKSSSTWLYSDISWPINIPKQTSVSQEICTEMMTPLCQNMSHLTRALTVERTTLESRKRGVTRIWKRDREAKATAGDRSASSEMWTWTTNVCKMRGRREQWRLVSKAWG